MPYFFNLPNEKLLYLDILTYVTITSFDNSNKDCFPSYEAIAERSGLSRTFIIESISRLENSNYLISERRGYLTPTRCYPNRYKFTIEEDYFFMIPYEIFQTKDLTNNEKAMLLALLQFAITPYHVYSSLKEIAQNLNLPTTTINKQYYSLVRKGYLDKSKLKDRITLLTNRIDWNFAEYLKINNSAEQSEVTLMVA